MNNRDESIETERSEGSEVVLENVAEGQSISEWEVFLLCSEWSQSHKPTELYGPLTEGWLHNQPEKVKEQLSLLFMRFLESLSATERGTDASSGSAQAPRYTRQREILWLERNKDDIKKFADNWIAIEADELIAASPEFSKVLEETRQRGIHVPFIVYVPPEIKSSTLDF